jgi:ParB-like chromosome segregation protein Spo0J
VPKVRVDSIIVGERLREDMGDIAGLAESIREYGLFHPIIVTADHRLVCGERRLAACKRIGMVEIEASIWEHLAEEVREEVEREENERRKPLTDHERSKRLVVRAQEAAADLERVLPESGKRTGRPPKDRVPEASVAQALGVGRTTLQEAKAHVSAVDSTPALAPLPQAKALRAAEALKDPETRAAFERVPEGDRPVVAAMIAEPGAPADGARRIAEGYASLPEDRRAVVREAVERKDMDTAITTAAHLPAMPDERLALLDQAMHFIGRVRSRTKGDTSLLGAATDALLEFRGAVKEGSV